MASSNTPQAPNGAPGNQPILSGRTVTKPVQKKEKRKVLRTVLIVLAVVVALVLAAAAVLGWFGWRLASTFDEESEVLPGVFPEAQLPEREDDAQTILLLGSDTRGHIDTDDVEGPQDGRSDTIMVARIPSDHSGVYIMSIMRDSWVDIPGYGDAKVNAAMAYGGVPLTIETIESLIGSRIDHVAVIDFEGFKGLTNALGGVPVYNAHTFSAGGFNFPQGDLVLNGDEALSFVRERKSFGDGDYQRVRNQQAYMKGLLSTILSRDTLTSPSKLTATVDAISPFIARDEGLNGGYIAGQAMKMTSIRPSDIHFFTAPTTGVGWSPDGRQSIILLDWTEMEKVKEAFETDTVAGLVGAY